MTRVLIARVDLAERSEFETPGSAIAGSQARPAPRLQRKIAIGHAVETSWAIPKPRKLAGTPSAQHAATPCHGPDHLHAQQVVSLGRCSSRRSPRRLVDLAIVPVITAIQTTIMEPAMCRPLAIIKDLSPPGSSTPAQRP
jgi:hypothetical protein